MHIARRGLAVLREQQPLRTTFDLAAAVTSVIPRTGPRHPATRIFQALRIAVNDELGVLQRGLNMRFAAAGARGTLCRHQLPFAGGPHREEFFRDRSVEWIDRPEWPEPRRNPDRIFRPYHPAPDGCIERGNHRQPTSPQRQAAGRRTPVNTP